MNYRAVHAEGLFLGHVRPGAHSSLVIEHRVEMNRDTLPLPEVFAVPIAGPNGKPIGEIEYRYLATLNGIGRWIAIGLRPKGKEGNFEEVVIRTPLPQY